MMYLSISQDSPRHGSWGFMGRYARYIFLLVKLEPKSVESQGGLLVCGTTVHDIHVFSALQEQVHHILTRPRASLNRARFGIPNSRNLNVSSSMSASLQIRIRELSQCVHTITSSVFFSPFQSHVFGLLHCFPPGRMGGKPGKAHGR